MKSAERVTYFAATDCRNSCTPFGIKEKDRSRHMYVIGKTGMGKSTMLENMAVQDIQNGEGITFIDPHGATAEKLLDYVPKERAQDVLYFAPFDLDNPISFNVLEKVAPDKRHLVVNGLMSTFEKIWVDAWSARMAYILQNTLLALLEYPDATLLGVNRMYTDKEFRKVVIENVTDPSVKSFWEEEFAKYTDRFAAEATPAIQNKIGQFSSNSLVRNIIGQPTSSFDLRKIMDEKKIFIVNLSKGRVGEGNANLLGSMLITKIYLAAMSRADLSVNKQYDLPNHYLYVDEFQSFANRSFADILSEARKYKLALTIAHQYIEQMEEEVRAAVFGNVGTMAAFRVGSYDAEILEKEFAPVFTQEDIVNLGFAQIYLKLMIDGISSQPFSATTLPPIEEPRISYRDQVIAHSRDQWSEPRAKVEERIRAWHEPVVSTHTKQKTEEKRERRDERRREEGGRDDSRPQERSAPRREPPSPPQRQSEREGDARKPRRAEAPNRPQRDDSRSSAPPQRERSAPEREAPTPPLSNSHNNPPSNSPSAEDLRATLKRLASKENAAESEKKPQAAKEAAKQQGARKEPEASRRNALREALERHSKKGGEGSRVEESRSDSQGAVPRREIPERELRNMVEIDEDDLRT